MPKFVLFLRDSDKYPSISPEEMQGVVQRYIAWRGKVQQSGSQISGHKLRDREGRIVSGSAGSPKVTDGPYAEGHEVMGGLFIIEAATYDAIVELTKDCPHLEFGSIEIREVQPT